MNKHKEEKIVFEDRIDDFDWVDDDLNPVLPQEYLDKIDEDNTISYDLKYDALVNRGIPMKESQFEKMLFHFKMRKEYDKVDLMYDMKQKLDFSAEQIIERLCGKQDKISKEDEDFLNSLGG